jgi:hypothetical protein
MRVFKKILKVFFFMILTFLILGVFLFKKIDRRHYKEMDYYQEMLGEVHNLEERRKIESGDTIKVGWAKTSLLPPYIIPLAGFGNRKGKEMEGIRDSLWVRAFVFDNELTKAVFVTMDMLIVPPEVEVALRNHLSNTGFNPKNLYLSATHTHSSIGAWGPGFTGEAIAGPYDPEIVDFITKATLEAINKADVSKEIAQIGYGKIDASPFVENRLVGDEGIVDPWIRFLKIRKKGGETAILSTFSAHATCFGHNNMNLSADYPGALVDSLEKFPQVHFAAYAAGGVASHRPPGMPSPEEQITHIASGLTLLISQQVDQVAMHFQKELLVLQMNLPLREPQVRISRDWRIRPWLYYHFFGDYPSYLSFLKIGNTILVGTPCDFSGELMPDLEKIAIREGYNLILTSFNGGYIGYITLDKWYDLNKYETRAMNWFGPYNGAYFSEYIGSVLTRI